MDTPQIFQPAIVGINTYVSRSGIKYNIDRFVFEFQLQFRVGNSELYEWGIQKVMDDFRVFDIDLRQICDEQFIQCPLLFTKDRFQKRDQSNWQAAALRNYLMELMQDQQICALRIWKEFLEVSEVSFHGQEKPYEGYLHKIGSSRVGNRVNFCNIIGQLAGIKKPWILVNSQGIFYYSDSSSRYPSDFIMFSRYLKFFKGFDETGYYCGIRVVGGQHDIFFMAPNKVRRNLWYARIVQKFEESNILSQEYPNYSSFRIQYNNQVETFVDGEGYYKEVCDQIALAEGEILITDWWICPQLYLKRPIDSNLNSQLLEVLSDAARNRGVNVRVIIWKEIEQLLYNNSLHAQELLTSLSNRVQVIRHPHQGIKGLNLWFSHHEKMVVIDRKIAFLGGLDLCYGRWDTNEHKIKDIDKPYFWNNIDYCNSRLRDKCNTRDQNAVVVDRQSEPRMPWHDLALKVAGPVVKDIAQHFTELWNHAMHDFTSHKDYKKKSQILKGELSGQEEESKGFFNKIKQAVQKSHNVKIGLINNNVKKTQSQEERQLKDLKDQFEQEIKLMQQAEENPEEFARDNLMQENVQEVAGHGTVTCQFLRSAGLWSLGLQNAELSIQHTYIKRIWEAKHFIYIENQFFISNTGGPPVTNAIAQTLVERIKFAMDNMQRFKVIVCMPLIPAFEGNVWDSDAAVMRVQLDWEYKTIIRSKTSIYSQLRQYKKQQGIQQKIKDYIQFYGLRNHDVWGEQPKQEMVYIHSKCMIVDDEYIIMGSANINDRSMLGERDSEIALLMHDQRKVNIRFNGQQFEARHLAHDLRMKIFNEFACPDNIQDLEDVFSPRFRQVWDRVAQENTDMYRIVFRPYPDDDMHTFEDIKFQQSLAQHDQYALLRQNVRGLLVQFPLKFLKNETIKPKWNAKIMMLPEFTFTQFNSYILKMELVSKVPRLLDRLKYLLYSKKVFSLDQTLQLFNVNCKQKHDSQGQRSLTKGQFENFLNEVGLFTSSQDLSELFRYFDDNKDSLISQQEFANGFLSNFSEALQTTLRQVWQFLDKEKRGQLNTQYLQFSLKPQMHPQVLQNQITQQQLQAQFQQFVQRFSQNGVFNENSFVEMHQHMLCNVSRELEGLYRDTLPALWGVPMSASTEDRLSQLESIIYEKLRQNSKGNDDEGKTMMRVFRHFDLDESNNVSFSEFQQVLERFGCYFQPQEVRMLFDRYDQDLNGTLDYQEFCKIFAIRGAKGSHAYKMRAEVPQELLDRIKNEILRRGANGIRGLGIVFRRMDNNGDRKLDRHEFEYALRDNGHILTPIELDQLYRYFDRDGDGKITYDEFLRGLRGTLNNRRRRLVRMAYGKLDKNSDGTVNIEDMRLAYDVSYHPDFINGTKTADQILTEFMSQWDTLEKDGQVTVEEFEDYYKDISASVDNDDEFELIVRNAWHIAGGEGWCENTTIPRHLVTDADGRQHVEMAKGSENFSYSKNLNRNWGGEV